MKLTKARLFTRKEQEEFVKNEEKGCSSCGRVLPVSKFGVQKTKIGYRSNCKYCRHVQDANKHGRKILSEVDFYHKVDKEYDGWDRSHIKSLERKFKLSFEVAKEMAEATNCEICGKSREENGKKLAVDHCHETGKVRGSLCSMCNKGLGSFKDNTESLKEAIKYLEKNK